MCGLCSPSGGTHRVAKRLVIGVDSRHCIQHRTNANGTEGFNRTWSELIRYSPYELCLDIERRHVEVKQWGTLSVLVCACLLGYLLRGAPTLHGQDTLHPVS